MKQFDKRFLNLLQELTGTDWNHLQADISAYRLTPHQVSDICTYEKN